MALLSTPEAFWQASPAGRLAGLDVGTKTIGLALSDPLRLLVSPAQVLVRTTWGETGPQLCNILKTQQVTGVVVGWPLHMNGTVSARCHGTRHFVDNLLALGDYPLILWDERLSTVAANRLLREEGELSHHKRKGLVDAVAARFILDSFLATAHR